MINININKINTILNKTFGFIKFKDIQEKIIKSILNKENTLGIMPTGGGKSLTYQIPGLYFPGTTIIISPLISLMQDQVNFLKSKKINATFYNGSLTNEEKIEVMNEIKEGTLKFLFIAPERLFVHELFSNNESFSDIIQKYINISLIVIDEAHCIASWGHDFREDYLRLKELKELFLNVPVLTLTATADPITKQEIISIFNIKEKNVFTMSIERKNLIYNIEKKYGNGFEQVKKIIKLNKNKKGIVYCFKKDDVNKLYTDCKRNGIKVEKYHADITDLKKKKVLNDFINNKLDVIIATIAFGMGIDKSNIGYIIHKDLPKNIESYYQETGRAGRDGKIAKLYLLYSGRDYIVLNWILNNSNRKWIEKIKLNWMKRFIQTSMCRKQMLNWYFENDKGKPCKKCDICKNKYYFEKEDKNFLEFINKTFFKKEINLFIAEKLINENFDKITGLDYLYQLIFSNKIIYKRKENLIYIDEIIKIFKFVEPIEINDNFPIKILKTKITRQKNKVRKKTIRKRKKRTITASHLKKLQEGRKKALLRKNKRIT